MVPIAILAILIALTGAFYIKSLGSSYFLVLFTLWSSFGIEVVLYLGYFSFFHRWFVSPTRKLPYPKNTPFFLGNISPFLSEPWGFPLAKWQQTIPSTRSGFYRIFLGPFDYLIPKSAKAIMAVMNQPYVFEKPAAVRDGLVESLGVGLVSAEGEVHRRQKKLLTPIFGLERNRRLVPQMFSKAIILREQMELLVDSSGGCSILEMHSLTMAASLDIIGVTTLGFDIDSLRQPNQELLKAYQAVFPSLEKQTLLMKFLGAVLPAIVSPHVLFKLPLARVKKFHWGMGILKEFCIDQINLKKQQLEKSGIDDQDVRQEDILSAIIASGMTNETELVSHLLTILAAGHESTAITLAWALFKLAQHPETQERLRKEIEAVSSTTDYEVPTLDLINSMPYLRCFLMELLRLYPAFPAMMRQAGRPTQIEDLLIPKGRQIMVSPWAVNRSTELWGDDADEFRVDRWEQSFNGGAKSSAAFLTFSSGQRTCIGKDFAIITFKVSLFVLLSRFKFEEAVPGWHPPIQKGTSLKPMGLKLKVSVLETVKHQGKTV